MLSERAALLEQRIEDVKRTIDVCQIGSYQVAQAAAKRVRFAIPVFRP
jgi:hypothetical protein